MSRRPLSGMGVFLAVALAPASAAAWGIETHRWIATRAAALVESRCPELVQGHSAALAARAVEPDTVLRARLGKAEGVHHYLDLDHYGAPPFPALPREYEAAVRKFGRERLEEQGTLPWHVGTLARRLARVSGAGEWPRARVLAGYLAHYAADATMPLHTTDNHDGQKTGQRGLHQRIEAKLIDARLDEYAARAGRVPRRAPITPAAAEAALFATLLDSYQAVADLLAADRVARRDTRVGSALYYRRLDTELRDLLADRVGAAAALTAALWEGACAAPAAGEPR